MCGRASLTKSISAIEKRLQAKLDLEATGTDSPLPNYNVAPTQFHPVVTSEAPDVIQLYKWGLIPFWAKDHKIGSRLINARSETILEKPSFKGIHKKRCIVPFDGFYEWKKTPDGKIPFRITLVDEGIFTIAGIWSSWKNPEGKTVYTFTLLTREPNELMAPIHNRMPAILLPEQEQLWLDTEIPASEVVQMLGPYPDEWMKAYAVSRSVNNARNNNPNLIKPV